MSIRISDFYAAQRRHANHYLQRLTKLSEGYQYGGDHARSAVEQLQRMWRQIQQAHKWSAGNIDRDDAAHLCISYTQRGWNIVAASQPLQERVQWLRRGLEAARILQDPNAEVECLVELGETLLFEGSEPEDAVMAVFQQAESLGLACGNYRAKAAALLGLSRIQSLVPTQAKEAQVAAHQALVLFRELDDKQGYLRTLRHLGLIEARYGDLSQARTYQSEALALATNLGEQREIAAVARLLADICERQAEYAAALEYAEEAVKAARSTGKPELIGNCLCTLGLILSYMGDQHASKRCYEEALECYRMLGDHRSQLRCYTNLGWIAKLEHDNSAALRYYDHVFSLARQLGSRYYLASTHGNRAAVLVETRTLTAAWMELRQGIEIAIDIGALDLVVDQLLQFSWLMILQGKLLQAAQILGAVLEHPLSEDPEQSDSLNRVRDHLRKSLSVAAFNSAVQAGSNTRIEVYTRELIALDSSS